MPRLYEFYPGICLTTEEKARKNFSQGKKNLSQVKKNLSQSTVYILPKHPHITKPSQAHTLQNPYTHTHIKHTHIMWKNMVQLGRQQITIWRMRFACWISKTTIAFTIYNIYWFSTTTMVALTCINITLYVYFLSCLCLGRINTGKSKIAAPGCDALQFGS
jgi:hypothetical protein